MRWPRTSDIKAVQWLPCAYIILLSSLTSLSCAVHNDIRCSMCDFTSTISTPSSGDVLLNMPLIVLSQIGYSVVTCRPWNADLDLSFESWGFGTTITTAHRLFGHKNSQDLTRTNIRWHSSLQWKSLRRWRHCSLAYCALQPLLILWDVFFNKRLIIGHSYLIHCWKLLWLVFKRQQGPSCSCS